MSVLLLVVREVLPSGDREVVGLPQERSDFLTARSEQMTWMSWRNTTERADFLTGDGVHKSELVFLIGVGVDAGCVQIFAGAVGDKLLERLDTSGNAFS